MFSSFEEISKIWEDFVCFIIIQNSFPVVFSSKLYVIQVIKLKTEIAFGTYYVTNLYFVCSTENKKNYKILSWHRNSD